jgi:hypothetical protein
MTESDVLPRLLSACLSFQSRWSEYVQDETYAPNEIYIDVGEFAQHLMTLLQAGKVEEFPAVFMAVEYLLEQGNEEARNAITIGFLEGLYFEAEDAGVSPREWRKYFGPRAIKAWEAYLVWAKKSD